MRFSATMAADRLLPQRLALRLRPPMAQVDALASGSDGRGAAGRMSAIAFVVRVLGKPMLGLFGEGFQSGYPLLFPLVVGVVARAAVGRCESLLMMSGHPNSCAAVFAVTLAFNIQLLPPFGLWGAAMAAAFAMIFEAAGLSFTVWSKLGIVMTIFIPARSAA